MAGFQMSTEADKPDRIQTAIVVRTFGTAGEAFAELDKMTKKLRDFGLAELVEMLVVDKTRRPIER
jgi:hypothetical protein